MSFSDKSMTFVMPANESMLLQYVSQRARNQFQKKRQPSIYNPFLMLALTMRNLLQGLLTSIYSAEVDVVIFN